MRNELFEQALTKAGVEWKDCWLMALSVAERLTIMFGLGVVPRIPESEKKEGA